MTAKIDLVDIGGGNIGSVKRCLQRLGIAYNNVGPDNPPDGSFPLLLPGVGAFGAVMAYLRKANFDATLKALIQTGTPYLGICVGMQILFEGSEEAKDCTGLGLLAGKVVGFKKGKVPQIGWNYIEPTDNQRESGYVYSVNSYYSQPVNDAITSYYANYHVPFCAAVQSNNITAFQFHPEKSGEFGGALLKRWLDEVV